MEVVVPPAQSKAIVEQPAAAEEHAAQPVAAQNAAAEVPRGGAANAVAADVMNHYADDAELQRRLKAIEAYKPADPELRGQEERNAELLALGAGQAQHDYLGEGQQGDLRMMMNDKRLGYEVNRSVDDLSRGGRYKAAAKDAVKSIPGKIKEALQPKNLASSAVNMIPGAKAIRSLGTAYKDYDRYKQAKAMAGDESVDDVSRSLAGGAATHHKIDGISKAVEGTISAVMLPVGVLDGGISSTVAGQAIGGMAQSAVSGMGVQSVASAAGQQITSDMVSNSLVSTGAGLAETGGKAVGQAVALSEREQRIKSRLPDRQPGENDDDYHRRVDSANQNLTGLLSADPALAKKMINYLAPGQMGLGKEMARVRQEAGGDGSHTISPSKAKELGDQEKARLRQRERMGAAPSWQPGQKEPKSVEPKAKSPWYSFSKPKPIPQAPPLAPDAPAAVEPDSRWAQTGAGWERMSGEDAAMQDQLRNSLGVKAPDYDPIQERLDKLDAVAQPPSDKDVADLPVVDEASVRLRELGIAPMSRMEEREHLRNPSAHTPTDKEVESLPVVDSMEKRLAGLGPVEALDPPMAAHDAAHEPTPDEINALPVFDPMAKRLAALGVEPMAVGAPAAQNAAAAHEPTPDEINALPVVDPMAQRLAALGALDKPMPDHLAPKPGPAKPQRNVLAELSAGMTKSFWEQD
jgi:hypothetical protein